MCHSPFVEFSGQKLTFLNATITAPGIKKAHNRIESRYEKHIKIIQTVDKKLTCHDKRKHYPS